MEIDPLMNPKKRKEATAIKVASLFFNRQNCY